MLVVVTGLMKTVGKGTETSRESIGSETVIGAGDAWGAPNLNGMSGCDWLGAARKFDANKIAATARRRAALTRRVES